MAINASFSEKDSDYVDKSSQPKASRRLTAPGIPENDKSDGESPGGQLNPMSHPAIQSTQSLIREIEECALGYVIIHAASDNEFNKGPTLRRRVYNKRIALPHNLDTLYRSTNRGTNLDALNPANCLKIGAGKNVFEVLPSTDATTAAIVQYKTEFHGLSYEDAKKASSNASLNWFPVLLDGGHRMDLMQQRVYTKAIQSLKLATDQLAAEGSDHEHWELELNLAKEALEGSLWLAKVYDMHRSSGNIARMFNSY